MLSANHRTNKMNLIPSLYVSLKLSKENSIIDAKHPNQAMSVSDLFYKYSYSMHLLCSNQNENIIPSGEEMIGYLIHRFNISDSPVDQNDECMSKFQAISS